MGDKKILLNAKDFNPFGQLLGLSFTKYEAGQSWCELNVVDQLLNPHQVLHGGVIYAMADTGMGAALYSDLAKGESCTTIEIKISYFKPVTSGQLICKTKIVNRGRKVTTLESEITNNQHLIAKATGTFYIIERKSS